jgi:integrase
VIHNKVSTVLNAAVDDGHLSKPPTMRNPCGPPAAGTGRVAPRAADRVFAVQAALPERYRAMVDLEGGCGLRQGEIFGLPVDEIGFDSGWVHIANQVKVTKEGFVFPPPKRNKIRDVPLPDRLAHILKRHMETLPPGEVALPWLRPDGALVTKRLLFTRLNGTGAVRRTDFNDRTWKPALVAAGGIAAPKPGGSARTRHARSQALLRIRVAGRRREHQGPEPSPRTQRSGVHGPGLHALHAE